MNQKKMNQLILSTDSTLKLCSKCQTRDHGEPLCVACRHNQALIIALKEVLAETKPIGSPLKVGTALHKAIDDMMTYGAGVVHIDVRKLFKEEKE